MSEVLIKSKYPNKCSACNVDINVGESIYWDTLSKKVRHEKCKVEESTKEVKVKLPLAANNKKRKANKPEYTKPSSSPPGAHEFANAKHEFAEPIDESEINPSIMQLAKDHRLGTMEITDLIAAFKVFDKALANLPKHLDYQSFSAEKAGAVFQIYKRWCNNEDQPF